MKKLILNFAAIATIVAVSFVACDNKKTEAAPAEQTEALAPEATTPTETLAPEAPTTPEATVVPTADDKKAEVAPADDKKAEVAPADKK